MKNKISPKTFGSTRILLFIVFFLSNIPTWAQPVLQSFSPNSGCVGTIVTINGSGLNQTDSVYIGGVKSLILTKDSIKITALVMNGAQSNVIQLYDASGIVNSTNQFFVLTSSFPSTQSGNLPSAPISGMAAVGTSLAISMDGKTAIVGAPYYNNTGASWIAVNTSGVWSLQGSYLRGSGGKAFQGGAVAISADGNTAFISGENDSIQCWIFVRNGSTWTQQASFLNLTGLSGTNFSPSTAISADGNTAVLGVYNQLGMGGFFILKRSNSIWSQFGSVYSVSDTIGKANFGESVSISADGKTILVSGPENNSGEGAVWVFNESAGSYAQQGAKLVAVDAIGKAQLGESIALTADGNIAIVGGRMDNSSQGAIWEFKRISGVWNSGTKITVPGSIMLGRGVAISTDGQSLFSKGRGIQSGLGNLVTFYSFKKEGSSWGTPVAQMQITTNHSTNLEPAGISISADGKVAIAGEPGNSYGYGSTYVFGSNPNVTFSVTGIGPAFFYTCNGTASDPKSFYLYGSALSSPCTLSADSSIEFSSNSGTNYSNPLSLFPNRGALDSMLIYVRIKSNININLSISGNILFSSGTYTKSIPVKGSSLGKPENNTISTVGNYCIGNSMPLILGSTPTGGNTNGNFTYKWIQSFTGNSGSFLPASGLNGSINYTPTEIKQSTWLKRVAISAECTDTSNSIHLVPNPKPLINYTINKPVQCMDGNNFIFKDNSYAQGDSFDCIWKFSNGHTYHQKEFQVQFNTHGVIPFNLIVNNINNQCLDSISGQVFVLGENNTSQGLCMVTVDSGLNKNIIIWERQNRLVQTNYLIYKEINITDSFALLANVPVDSAGIITDQNSNPLVKSDRYKISTIDTCGNESPKSEAHKTMHLNANRGMDNQWNLIWENYEGKKVNTIKLYRGTTPNNLTFLNSVSSSISSYTDITAPSGPVYYLASMEFATSCDPSKLFKRNYSITYSNILNTDLLGLGKIEFETIKIYPNPTNSYVAIENTGKYSLAIEVINTIGQVIDNFNVTTGTKTHDISAYPNGIYFFVLKSESGSHPIKIVKQ